MSVFSLLDKRVRSISKRYLVSLFKNPSSFFDRVHLQSFMIIQPIDVLPDGRASMCDGCPDMTVHNGELVWSCRLEELQKHGCFLTAAPKKPGQAEA